MALAPITPRDKLQRITDLARKTARYWWMIALFALVGGALSLAFAVFKPKNYQSWSTLFYQERIQSSLMSPNREEMVQRNIGDRYRELLLARSQLMQIVTDPALDPFPDEDDVEVKIDELRKVIKFEARGANAFRINFRDTDPARAKRVTEKLTSMLQAKDEELRNDQATRTVNFATTQKEAAAKELAKSEQALATFLAAHPEFAEETSQGNSEGASIRAIREPKTKKTGNSRLYALERQRQRIQARLDASPDGPPVRIIAPPSPERVAAEAAANEAQRQLTAAQRELDGALSRYTEKHPEVIKAQANVAAAQQRYRTAQAAVPPLVETAVAPTSKQDREKLEKQLAQLEEQIANAQSSGDKKDASQTDKTTNWVVKLETEHAILRREVSEQRERVGSLAASVFRAQIDASQKLAEQGGRLSVVDPAFKPVKPTGPGKTIFLLAGMMLFLTLGTGLALGLAMIDDRIYHRIDLDNLGIGVLAVIPPAQSLKGLKPAPKKEQRK
ncbi:MAG: GumC family protein [Kofleriaceae bacterium]